MQNQIFIYRNRKEVFVPKKTNLVDHKKKRQIFNWNQPIKIQHYIFCDKTTVLDSQLTLFFITHFGTFMKFFWLNIPSVFGCRMTWYPVTVVNLQRWMQTDHWTDRVKMHISYRQQHIKLPALQLGFLKASVCDIFYMIRFNFWVALRLRMTTALRHVVTLMVTSRMDGLRHVVMLMLE